MTVRKEYIENKLLSFNGNGVLKGLNSKARMDCLVNQIIDSIERVNRTTNPHNTYFNPIYLAKSCKEQGNIDEACWLAFLATHFGEHENGIKSNHVRNVYYALGSSSYWTWDKTSSNMDAFRQWLQSNKETLQANGRFGNHRKYESLLDEHTGKTIASYIDWVASHVSHKSLFTYLMNNNRYLLFDTLYKSMNRIWRFGRTAKFDYLCLLGKLGIFDIEPGHPYLFDATGPLIGAQLLFGSKNIRILNEQLRRLGEHLELYFGMQVIEDAVCNWQKSPNNFISFLPV